jgi:hypothetical protein
LFPTAPGGQVTANSFQLVDQAGNPVLPTGPVSTITLSAEGAPGFLTDGMTADPLWDATDATPGGGDAGTVMISPLITPGTVSDTFYNHYSMLRFLEDIFQVSLGEAWDPLPAGTVSGGLDGLGHLGFAAQEGLRPFGADVFTNAGHDIPPPPEPDSPTDTGPSVDTGGVGGLSAEMAWALLGIVAIAVAATGLRFGVRPKGGRV